MNGASESPVLEVRDLVKHFSLRRSWFRRGKASVRAVDGVSLKIEAGSTTALVGESGCGKSTIARLILQLLRPDSGEILLHDTPVVKASAAFRRSVQMIFQDPYSSLTPHLTIEALLREPLAIHDICPPAEMRDRLQELVAAVGLPGEILSRYPHELSGGQRQRIGIARAISVDPKLVVCDEPVSALDVSVRSQIVNLLLDLQRRRNLSYLFVSHDLDLVDHVSDTVAVMQSGKIVEQAPTARFFAGPEHPYSRTLLSSSLVPDPRKRKVFAATRGEVAGAGDAGPAQN